MKVKKPRMLVVGMMDSTHLVTWLSEISNLNIFSKIFVVPSTSPLVDANFMPAASASKVVFISFKGIPFRKYIFTALDKIVGIGWRTILLRLSLFLIRPQLIHIHEIQHGGYMLNENLLKKKLPKIVISTWGSDLVLYGMLESHKPKIRRLLERADGLLAERLIDLDIASSLGFNGIGVAPSFVTIGVLNPAINPVAASQRRKIVIKGYQDNHGRALNALQAIYSIESELIDFEIVVISASESVRVFSEFLRSTTCLNIICAPKMSKTEIATLFTQARIYIGLSISDGISNTMVESMEAGAFPIQSINSSAPEFIIHGKSGFVVDPWDIQGIAEFIKQSLINHKLVDSAMELNNEILKNKFNKSDGLVTINNLYGKLLNE